MSDSAELHLVHVAGNTLVEEGQAEGTFPGRVRAKLDINAAQGVAKASFTLFRPDGTVYGHSSGRAESGEGGWESFTGKLKLKGGSGHYEGASGGGTMSGAIYRRNDRVKVQEHGTLHY